MGETNQNSGQLWEYTHLFDRAQRDGHLYPAPACGSPTLVWHFALAPRRRFGDDPRKVESRKQAEKRARKAKEITQESLNIDLDRVLRQASKDYDEDFDRFINELNTLVTSLQEKGRIDQLETFKLEALPADPEMKRVNKELHKIRGEDEPDYQTEEYRFSTASPQTLTFTLWWSEDQALFAKLKEPTEEDVRVQVQVQTHTGYASVTFLIDASKPYGQPQREGSRPFESINTDKRRDKILRALNIIRSSMTKQVQMGLVDKPRIPETGVANEEARDLLEASEFIYQKIWDDFIESFGLTMFETETAQESIVSTDNKKEEAPQRFLGRRFADMRGHVMSVGGLTTPEDVERFIETNDLRNKHTVEENKHLVGPEMPSRQLDSLSKWEDGYGLTLDKAELPNSTIDQSGFGPLDAFDVKRNEAHTVLRSLWPFVRRLSPWADYREVVGCGVMGWRALYLSTLGDSLRPPERDEGPHRSDDIPAGHLSSYEKIWGKEPHEDESEEYKQLRQYRNTSRPIRFLVVTKGEPQREQLGRFVSRMMTLETLRFFALRNITTIRNAGVHLELIDRQLDGILQDWSTKRAKTQQEHDEALKELNESGWFRGVFKRFFRFSQKRLDTPEFPLLGHSVNDEHAEVDYKRASTLSSLISRTESQVIALAAALDSIGEGGAGRILYLIRRAELAIQDYLRLLPTLHEGSIDGWTSYQQFVNRGLKGSFGFIKLTGTRLISIQKRLQTVTETIQTAALIAEAEATQRNTHALREVAMYFAKTWRLLRIILWVLAIYLLEYVLPSVYRPSSWAPDAISWVIDLALSQWSTWFKVSG